MNSGIHRFYKRLTAMLLAICMITGIVLGPVSYTHLDVYKRQERCLPSYDSQSCFSRLFERSTVVLLPYSLSRPLLPLGGMLNMRGLSLS